MNGPERPVRPDFDRARNPAAHRRARQEASLAPRDRTRYEELKRQEAERQDEFERQQEAARHDTVEGETRRFLLEHHTHELRLGSAQPMNEKRARALAEDKVQREYRVARERERQRARERLDKFLRDHSRDPGDRER